MPLTSLGGNDGFVAKYALDGTVQWARRFGGSYSDEVRSVAVDPTGPFVYATGIFRGSADFDGNGVPDAQSNKGSTDVFLVKLNAATGQTVWFKTLGSANQDEGRDVATDGTSVYVTGSIQGTGSRLPAEASAICCGVLPSKAARPSFMGVFTPVG